jgi:hypothetical protein
VTVPKVIELESSEVAIELQQPCSRPCGGPLLPTALVTEMCQEYFCDQERSYGVCPRVGANEYSGDHLRRSLTAWCSVKRAQRKPP